MVHLPHKLGEAAASRSNVSQHTTQRTARRSSQPSEPEGDDDIQIVWSTLSSQTSPTQQLETVIREELLPGEAALLSIMRGNNPKKDPEQVCIHCNRTFANRENKLKDTERCYKGTTNHTIGKVGKEYVCVKC